MPEQKPLLKKYKQACRCPSCGCKCDSMPEGSDVCFACQVRQAAGKAGYTPSMGPSEPLEKRARYGKPLNS